jgi:hypothetical protein
MNATRAFRLFISSTFSDFIAEREALKRNVFPRLEQYCAERGAQFQAIDLRWGITEQAQREHKTLRICLEEVRRCQHLSPRPNFAVLLGNRYGWEPVPARIPVDHWKRLRKLATSEQWGLISESYRLDENAIPSVYCLNKRSASDEEARQHEIQLLDALRKAAAGFRGSNRLPYFTSATHQEIVLGALSKRDADGQNLNPKSHVHVYERVLEAMPIDLSAKDFVDWDSSCNQIVPGTRQRMQQLKNQLRRQLGDNYHELTSAWNRHGHDGAVDQAYLQHFCDLFFEHQTKLIDAEIAMLGQIDDRKQREYLHHNFGKERARVFAGRKPLLSKIARYTNADFVSKSRHKKNTPLILIGGGGSGKSALLARAAQEVSQDKHQPRAVILQRYVGGVPGTEALLNTLYLLIADIATYYGHSEPLITTNINELVQSFEAVLGYATLKRPLILFLDALDQLDQSDRAWMLEWLPRQLPDHVRIIASIRSGTEAAEAACERFSKQIIDVPRLKRSEGRAVLKAWLADKREPWFNAGLTPSIGRRLTKEQETQVLSAFDKNGLALWLKIVYQEASTWNSWNSPRDLPIRIEDLIHDIVDQKLLIQEQHPKVFTERALGYLTASRFGLAENEIGRALGRDCDVRVEFQENEKTLLKWEDDQSLPPIMWSRLFFDLQAYLGFAQINGKIVMRWFHREFHDVFKARYLAASDERKTIHGALADAFLELDREIRPEELNDDAFFKVLDASQKPMSAALRRVAEQPWQLAQAGRNEDLERLITDFGFCMGKCAANQSRDLIQDFHSINLLAVDVPIKANQWLQFLKTIAHLLDLGDEVWPAHRILLQLALEQASGKVIAVAASKWQRAGLAAWKHAVSMLKPQELPPSNVNWISSGHELEREGWSLGGVSYFQELLWGWDKSHLCVWNATDGCIMERHYHGSIYHVVACGKYALVIDGSRINCFLYDPLTGKCKWTFGANKSLKRVQLLNQSQLLIADEVASSILEVQTGKILSQYSHDTLQVPKHDRRYRLTVQVLDARWLVYTYADRFGNRSTQKKPKFFVAVYDLKNHSLVFAGNLAQRAGFFLRDVYSYMFWADWQKQEIQLSDEKLYIWNGRLYEIDLKREKLLSPVDLTDQLITGSINVNPGIQDIEIFAANSCYMVFMINDGLSAFCTSTGQVTTFPLTEKSQFTHEWLSKNKLALLTHDPFAATIGDQNYIWDIPLNENIDLSVPKLERMVILSSNEDTLILSRDLRYDTDEGDYAQVEPLVSYNLKTNKALVIYAMNRVIGNTKNFTHTWLNNNQLVVMDGTDLVCLMTDQGVEWVQYEEISLGSMVTITEDWKNEHFYAAIGTERVQYFDLTENVPKIHQFSHSMTLGAVGELSGKKLTLWEDCNGLYESGGFGQFVNWQKDTIGSWKIDVSTLLEFLIAECPDFDGFDSYTVTQVGDFLVLCQGDNIHTFASDENSGSMLVDTLQGKPVCQPFWVRGNVLYFQDEDYPNQFSEIVINNGYFGQATSIKRESVFRPGEVAFQNIRPYRDMNCGPMKKSQLFKLGTAVGGWTLIDAVLDDQPREYITFIGPCGEEVRWFSTRDCRILPHRISFTELEGRQLFSRNAPTEDMYSISIDERIYFIALADGAVQVVKLMDG